MHFHLNAFEISKTLIHFLTNRFLLISRPVLNRQWRFYEGATDTLYNAAI